MRTFKGTLLLEAMIVVTIFGLIAALFVSQRPREEKGKGEEAGVIFMGALLEEMRDSSESERLNHLYVRGDTLIHLNSNRVEKKRTYLPEGVKVLFRSTIDPKFTTGLSYSFSINQLSYQSGELTFVKDGGAYLRMMINFGSYTMDLR